MPLTRRARALLLLFVLLLTQSRALCEPAASPVPVPKDTLRAAALAVPDSMVLPGEAQISLTLFNDEEAPVSDIRLCRPDGEIIAEIPSLSSGDQPSYAFSERLTIDEAALKAGGASYLVRYTVGKGQPDAYETEQVVTALIEKAEAAPELEFTRAFSSQIIQKGEEVAITYRLKNTGNVALTNLTVTDALLGDIGALENLEPGAKHAFTRRYRVDEPCVSKPSVRYSHVATNKSFTKDADPASIYLANEDLTILLESDKSAVSPGDVVTLRMKLTNNGNVAYDQMRISDQSLGDLGAIPSEIKPGQEYVFSKTVTLKTTTTFLFTVTGHCTSGGDLNASSNLLTVAVSPVVDDISLSLTAVADPAALAAPGTVLVTLRVLNEGELDLRNVRLSEQTRGEIRNLAVAAPGETVVEQRYDVSGDEQFVFLAEVSDALGGRLTVVSDPLVVTLSADGGDASLIPAPSVQASLPDADAQAYSPSDKQIYPKMMIGVLALLLVLLFAIILGALKRSKLQRKQNERRLRRLSKKRPENEAMEITRTHAPVKRTQEEPTREQKKDD